MFVEHLYNQQTSFVLLNVRLSIRQFFKTKYINAKSNKQISWIIKVWWTDWTSQKIDRMREQVGYRDICKEKAAQTTTFSEFGVLTQCRARAGSTGPWLPAALSRCRPPASTLCAAKRAKSQPRPTSPRCRTRSRPRSSTPGSPRPPCRGGSSPGKPEIDV